MSQVGSVGRGRGRGRIVAAIGGNIKTPEKKSETSSPPGGLVEKVMKISVTDEPSHSSQSRCVALRIARELMIHPCDEETEKCSTPVSITLDTVSGSSPFSTSSHAYSLPRRSIIRAPVTPKPIVQPAQNLPRRPNFNAQGRLIKLLTNHFPISSPDTVVFYHYDMSIFEETNNEKRLVPRIEWTGPRVPKRTRDERCNRSYEVYLAWARQFISEDFFSTIYDRQRHVYSRVFFGKRMQHKVQVGVSSFEVTLTTNNESPTITVSSPELKRVAFEEGCERDRSPLTVLDVLHNQMLYFKQCLGQSKYVPHGRCFYTDENKVLMPMGRELKQGFIKSLRLVNGPNTSLENPDFQLTMNIDFKMSPFFKVQNLLQTTKDILKLNLEERRELRDKEYDLLRHHLRELRVKTLHTGRIFTIDTVGYKPCDKEVFNYESGPIDVANYFQSNYRALEHPELPCVRDMNKSWYPIEVCEVLPNQKVDLKKLTPDQSSIIIKAAAVAPNIRRQKIMEQSNVIAGLNGDNFLKAMGLERSRDMLKVDGRVLTPPNIKYGQGQATVIKGSWQIGNNRCAFPVTINNYIVLCFERTLPTNVINAFITSLVNKAKRLGITMPDQCVSGGYGKVDDFLEQVNLWKRQKNIDLAICIMADSAIAKDRNDIKYVEKQTEVVTQCLSTKTLNKFARNNQQDTLLENILLKINAKCGGLNSEIVTRQDPVAEKWFTDKTMFVGLDVNHPPPLSKREIAMGAIPKKPSVVGAVANVGARIHDYSMIARAQDARLETIVEDSMHPIIKKYLKSFAEYKQDLPESIVVYRDGVSESQFAMVMNEETIYIKNACSRFREGYKPKLTIVTVQKRHNTRFFKYEPVSGKNIDQNVPSGTVVDTGPVGPYQFDFFLASQAGIQGTTKAAYYVVIHDENNFQADELQRLTFLLCHVYQKATKSVSLPAPCYYAHHAATRGKELVDGYLNLNDESSSGISSQSDSSRANSITTVGLDFDKINTQIAYGDKFGMKSVFL